MGRTVYRGGVQGSCAAVEVFMFWILMLVIGLAAIGSMWGFAEACDRL